MATYDRKKPINQKNIISINAESLKKQSRSFAIPILNMDLYLQKPIMAEYNLNKTIDTIEDSLNLNVEEKAELIDEFCKYLSQGAMSNYVKDKMISITPEEEQFVFKNYAATINLYNSLSLAERELALSKTIEMADGMKKFLNMPINTMSELNEYCYYVAGTVGQYLVELIQIHHKYEKELLHKQLQQALGFGRFLQKLNIIRDFHEDEQKNQGTFWPKQILENHQDKIYSLNYLCHNTLSEDAELAINFFEDLPEFNKSFDAFIKFILMSGLEYIKILKNNNKVFSKYKVKLSKLVITSLYKKIYSTNKKNYITDCRKLLIKELDSYNALLKTQTN
jgi:farnesyl-diphosphate farnesyltransferase